MATLHERGERVLSPAASHATSIGVERGDGIYLYSDDGRRYLDFASGIAVAGTGHCHPKVVEAAKSQTERLIHGGHNVVYYEPYVRLAERLVDLTGGDTMVFFSNSGAEANEGAMKLAKYVSGRPAIISFKGGFHGRTMGALSVTASNAGYRKGYEGLLPSVYFAEYPYCYRCPFGKQKDSCGMECLVQFDRMFKLLVDPETVAAFIVEPVQGEGGYVVPPVEFLQGLREICDARGILLILDEVQTGFGRTGRMFAYEHFGVRPDILSLGKAIASGFPLSAVVGRADLMKNWRAGAHGGTFGGNPVACAAGLATLDVLEDGAIANAAEVGEYALGRVREIQRMYPVMGDVRGLGLMIGMEFCRPDGTADGALVDRILEVCQKNGLLLLSCGGYKNVIRLMPPLIVTKGQMDDALAIFEAALQEVVPR